MIALPDGFGLAPGAAAVAVALALLAVAPYVARLSWRPALLTLPAAGGILFGVTVIGVQVPVQSALVAGAGRSLSPFWLGAHVWVLPVAVALVAAVLQEAARLAALAVTAPVWRTTWAALPAGALVGGGVGLFEAALVLGGVPPSALHLFSVAVLERAGAMAFHVGAGAALGLGWRRRRLALLWLTVVAVHWGIDGLAGLYAVGAAPLLVTEAVGLVAGIGLWAACRFGGRANGGDPPAPPAGKAGGLGGEPTRTLPPKVHAVQDRAARWRTYVCHDRTRRIAGGPGATEHGRGGQHVAEVPSIRQILIDEIAAEERATRRTLERVPQKRWDWAPHAKSMPMGRLAGWVAVSLNMVPQVLDQSFMDMAADQGGFPEPPPRAEALVPTFDGAAAAAKAALSAASDADLAASWSLRQGSQTMWGPVPKFVVVRGFTLADLIHHRAQLGVYLRLLDIAVPAVYGPSADEAE